LKFGKVENPEELDLSLPIDHSGIKFPALLTILIASLCFVSSCSKDGPYTDCEEYYFSDNFKEYVAFDTGSYWVFSDASLSTIDSVCLKEQSIIFFDRCDYNSIPSEHLFHTFYSSITDSVFKVSADAHSGVYGDFDTHYYGVFSDDSRPQSDYSVVHEMNFELNGESYSDVSIVTKRKGHLSYYSVYYWAKGVGLIQSKVFSDKDSLTSVRQLLRFKVK